MAKNVCCWLWMRVGSKRGCKRLNLTVDIYGLLLMVMDGYGKLLMVKDSSRWLWRQLMSKCDNG